MTGNRSCLSYMAAAGLILAGAVAAGAFAAAPAAPAAPAAQAAPAGPATPGPAPWWIRAIRADGIPAPGPGKPVAFVDTGIDMGLSIFARRRDTIPLNSQRLLRRGQYHGSAVASLVVAPGIDSAVVGVYPRARLVVWNATANGELTLSEIVRGIDAVSARGPSVINLSVGGGYYSFALKNAVLRAIARGSLVVAAVGNERPLVTFLARPAGEPHVFTVASVGPTLAVSRFSSQSSGIDVGAPGEDLRVAVPLAVDETGEQLQSGTSFAAAIASGAAAWVWTRRPELDNTQLFDVLRRSARHVGMRGVNNDTGFGVIDVAAALRYPAPLRDPQEPNDDIEQVAPGAIVPHGRPLLISAARRHGLVQARLDATKDPHDVFRVVIPPRATLLASAVAPPGTRIRLWDSSTRSVDGITDDQPDHFLASNAPPRGAAAPGASSLRFTNTSATAVTAYLDVWLVGTLESGSYRLEASLAAG
jgi:hypothetical protein